jgi:hypothetical protein
MTEMLFTSIAQKHLCIRTLAPRGSDALDFHDLSVWQVKRALQAAYEAGIEAGKIAGGQRE